MTVGENSATPDGAVHAYCILGKARPRFIVAPFTLIVSGQIQHWANFSLLQCFLIETQ